MSEQNSAFAEGGFGAAAQRGTRWSGLTDIGKMMAASCLVWFAAKGMLTREVHLKSAGSARPGADATVLPIHKSFANQAEMICRANNPLEPAARTFEATGVARMRGGRVINTISIDCLSKSGEHIASVLWDAQSGQIISVGCKPPEPIRLTGQMSKSDAVEAAWGWMRATGIAAQSSQWDLDRAAIIRKGQWCVWFKSGDLVARVQVSSTTGKLFAARVYMRTPC